MKTKLFTLLLAVAASVGTMFAWDYERVQIGDLYYNLDATNQTAEVTYQLQWNENNYKGLTSANIPASVTYASVPYAPPVTYTVTSIGSSAFYNCTGLTSVTIPNSVTSIGNMAFGRCSGLTSVTIPNSVTSIEGSAFYDCTGLTSVTIPNSVTSIGEDAFDGCSSLPVIDNIRYADIYLVEAVDKTLSTYTIKEGTKFIGNHAFSGRTGLTSIEIPNSVTSIGDYAFADCTGLTSVTIPNSVTSIGEGAFEYCSGLTSVTIPNSVTSIGNMAFWYCSGLTSIEIPNSVTSIEDGAFADCTGLTSVTIPNSVTYIGIRAFEDCTGLTSVVWDAKDCSTSGDFGSQVTSFVFGNEVETIPAACCSGMNITSITIPNSVTSIGYSAFADCTGLTSVTIPNSVTSIGDDAFADCTGLTSPVYNAHVFAFMPTSYSGAYTIPDGIKSIAGGAFFDCSGLTSVTIPNSVTSIGSYAFSRCTGLTSVTIPDSVTSIGYSAFSGCTGLTSVTIPNSVTSIRSSAFYGCSGLTAIYVPCGEMERFKQMLNNDSRINDHAPLPYTITINEEHGNVTYPQTMCDDMSLNATPDYGYHFVQWSDGVTNNPRAIVLTQDTTFTAEFAYDRVGTCGKDLALVWSYDPNSKVLTIGNAGEFTENIRFGVEAPNEMEELVIGNSVTAIGENAFAGISTLKKVTIGESVKTIGEQAFYNCVNLETIFNYRQTPTNAYSTAFDGVDKFECKLYVLPNSIAMYKAAAVWRDFYYTYAIGAEETTVTTNDVTVEPQDNAATLTWPTSNNAASYTIQITKDGVVFCTLIFNSNGQLTGIAFAPSRDGQAHAPAALMTANGLQFTVTGLDSGTQYGYSVTAKDANDQTVATYSGSFTTTSEGTATGIENTPFPSGEGRGEASKLLRNGQILILRGDKVYNAQGALVK